MLAFYNSTSPLQGVFLGQVLGGVKWSSMNILQGGHSERASGALEDTELHCS